jgi:predicted amidophosphoribosyltransferase
MNFVCPSCHQGWGQAEGTQPECPVCHTAVALESGVENAGTGYCPNCNKHMDQHNWMMDSLPRKAGALGSMERACPVVGRR